MIKKIAGISGVAWSLALILALTTPVWGANDNDDESDRTLSPYFVVQSDDPDTDRLPLKKVNADVKITGIIAETTITQVYRNEGRNTLEAIYVFPGSTRAAVHSLRMTIGPRVIEAEIMERRKARQTYEQAKQEGRTASLLEQQRPNVFQMNVANILPGDEILVELKYSELLIPEDGIYEFVFPTVVGPRYSQTPAEGAPPEEKWVENPYLHQGEDAPYDFDLNVNLTAGMPIKDISTPGNECDLEYEGADKAHASPIDKARAARKDFVLRYRLAGSKIETGLILYPGNEEKLFLLLMEPPQRVKPKELVPREYIFIVDVSGSMNGFPLNDIGKPLMSKIINDLRPQDYMNVLLFAGGSALLSPDKSLPANSENKARAVSWINSRQGGGGTNLLPALKRALSLPKTEGVSRIITIITDGYVSVEKQAFELVRENLNQANLFAFGVGSSVNRHLIEGLARSGRGEPFVVLNPSQGAREAEKFRDYINSPVLTDINIKFEGLDVYDVEPPQSPDLFARRPLAVFGKYRGPAHGEITVTGRTAAGIFKKEITVDKAESSADYRSLPLLWARDRIGRISDLYRVSRTDPLAEEITNLGLKYHLMTQFTSFVAVDKIKRADGSLVTVKQPLPLPEGVSDLAVGGADAMQTRVNAAPMLMAKAKRAGGILSETAAAVEEDKEIVKAEQPPTHIRMTVEKVVGGLDKAVLEKTLQDGLRAFEVCLRREEFLKKKKVPGKIVFQITLGPDGRVVNVKVVSSTLNSPDLETCLQVPFSAFLFPPPAGGKAEFEVTATLHPEG